MKKRKRETAKGLKLHLDLCENTLAAITSERNTAVELLRDFLHGPTMFEGQFQDWKARGEAFLRDIEAAS